MQNVKKSLSVLTVLAALAALPLLATALAGKAGASEIAAADTGPRAGPSGNSSPALTPEAVKSEAAGRSNLIRIAQDSQTGPPRGNANRARRRRHGGGSNIGVGIGGIGIMLDLARERDAVDEPEDDAPKRTTPRKSKRKTGRRRSRRPSRTVILPDFRLKEVVVLIRPDAGATVERDIEQSYGLAPLDGFSSQLLGGRVQKYRVLGNRRMAEVIAALEGNPSITAVSRNHYFRVDGEKSGKTGYGGQYSLTKMGIPSAHKLATGHDVPIAVIDAGIDAGHPALKNNIAAKFNAVGDKEDEAHTHGTAIAGIIGGHGKVRGVAPGAKLLAIRAFYTSGRRTIPETTTFILLRALDWAAGQGARIYNLSFSGPKDALIEAALNQVYLNGAVLIAAAGNKGADAPPAYPAAYDAVLAITATDQADRLYDKANRGPYLTVAAPGVDVLVAAAHKSYRYSSGTSFAAAHVSGLAALLIEQNSGLSPDDVKSLIMASAKDLGAKGYDNVFGAGRVDAHRSLLKLIEKGRGSVGAIPAPAVEGSDEIHLQETAVTIH